MKQNIPAGLKKYTMYYIKLKYEFSLIGRAMIISAMLFSKAVFFQIYFPQLKQV